MLLAENIMTFQLALSLWQYTSEDRATKTRDVPTYNCLRCSSHIARISLLLFFFRRVQGREFLLELGNLLVLLGLVR